MGEYSIQLQDEALGIGDTGNISRDTMKLIIGWIMPIAFVIIGVAIMSGILLTRIPDETLLRPVMGVVVILIGIHRFVVSRMPVKPRERRFGGDRPRPWDEQK